MATYLTLLILVMGIVLSTTADDREDLEVAIQEMQTANYFSFVMLIKMYPPDRIPKNVTFLMPNDRMLSRISLPENSVYQFLLRHSIPSPLLFDYLKHFPTGSTIPTSDPNLILRVSNNGRRNFYLNDIQIISPNICTAGSLIRCHGIKGVLMTTEPEHNTTLHSPPCFNETPHNESAPAPTNPSWSPPPVSPLNQIPMLAPPPNHLEIESQKSGSSTPLARGLLHSITPCMILSLVALQI